MATPMNTKMDLLQFQRMMIEEHGEENCEFDSVKRIAMITFRRLDNGNIAGFSTGRTIYRDRESERIINEGETWFCELKQNPKIPHQYFAKAILKVDAGFLFDLRKDQYDEIVDTIWENHRKDIESDLEIMYVNTIEERATSIADERVSEYEAILESSRKEMGSYREKVDELGSNLERRTFELRDMEANNQLLNERIHDLEQEIELLRQKNTELMTDMETNRHRTVRVESRSNSESIIRTDMNTIYSSKFIGSRYKVRFTSDMRRMIITEDADGEVGCSNNVIRLKGLNRIAPFDVPGEMPSESSDNGRIVIELG